MQVMKACQAIGQLGHEVRLFLPVHNLQTQNVDFSSLYGLNSPPEIEWMPSRRYLHHYDFAFQAVRKARRLNADACYIWLVQAGVYSLLFGLPAIIELHGPPEGRFGPALFRLFRLIPGKKRILPITHALAEQLHESFSFDINNPSLTCISPNGVDLEHYSNLPGPGAARELLNLPPLLTIGYTGHLYPGRGMSLLVELAKRFPNIHFLWVGGQPSDISLWRDRISTENIENITLMGFIQNSQLPMYQAAADILLMPYENLITGSSGGNSAAYASPMKMFEYMASKRAIISSDLPVIREILNPTNAILCPPGDIPAWSRSIESLVTDENKRLTIAQQAWKDVQQYTWQERARKALAGFETQ
jgi:glycosyltransferase involved in cell wall biosynthesis